MSYPSPSAMSISGNYSVSGTLPKKRKKISRAFSSDREGVTISPATFVGSAITNEKMISSLATIGIEERAKIICIRSVTTPRMLNINFLKTLQLKEPIQAVLEPDDDGFIVRTTELPLYGFGDNPNEAVENLKIEIETLFFDLAESDNFSEEWLTYKDYLSRIVIR